MPELCSGIFWLWHFWLCRAGTERCETSRQAKQKAGAFPGLLPLFLGDGLEIAEEIQQDNHKERNAHKPSDNAFHLILHAAPVACLIGMKR
jgi:hypothetical protein